MQNQFYGVFTILLCSIGYAFSWKYESKNNYKLSLLLLIICGLALRIYTSTDFYLHAWDERYHALVAKNLIKHPLTPTLYDNPALPYDYQSWVSDHIWLHKPPLPLWTMAASMWLFGVNEIALRLPSIILSAICIWLTFAIGSYFINKKTGFLAAFLFSINGLIVEITAGRVATDHIDVFFLFLIELAMFFSIVFAQRKKVIYNILAGISIGAAILSKWLPALIVLPIWLLIVIDSKNFSAKAIFKHFIVLIIFTFLIFIPWQLYIYKTFPLEAAWESGYYLKHITEVLDKQGGPFYYYFDKIRINYGELIYMPLLWFIWKLMKNPKDLRRLAICIWFLIPFLFFSFFKTKMQGYILFTSPALFIMTSDFWYKLKEMMRAGKLKWLINLVLFLLIALPIRYTIERIKPFEKMERSPQWVSELKKLNGRQELQGGILFNYKRPIEAMFYTNLTVYSEIPDKSTISALLERGKKIIINDDLNIPNEVKSLKGLTFIHLNDSNE